MQKGQLILVLCIIVATIGTLIYVACLGLRSKK